MMHRSHQVPFKDLMPHLAHLVKDELTLQEKEALRMSTDCSDRRAWVRILRMGIQFGRRTFQGPSGLRERMERLDALTQVQATKPTFSVPATPTEPHKTSGTPL